MLVHAADMAGKCRKIHHEKITLQYTNSKSRNLITRTGYWHAYLDTKCKTMTAYVLGCYDSILSISTYLHLSTIRYPRGNLAKYQRQKYDYMSTDVTEQNNQNIHLTSCCLASLAPLKKAFIACLAATLTRWR